MFKSIEGISDPHVEQVFGLYGAIDHVYTEEDWVAIYTTAKINLDNLLVKAFGQAVDQFRNEVVIKRADLNEVPLSDKFVVCSVLTGIFLDNWESHSSRWTGHQVQLDRTLMAFTGIDPTHLGDIEYIHAPAKDRPGIELTIRLRLNIKPDSGVKYIFEPEEWDHV